MAMSGDTDTRSWADLLHNSTQLLQAATPSAQFPPIQRNLDQLEALSRKLKERTSRLEAPNQNIAATRLLAREGINADQLTRDLKSFELKTSFEDVFPIEATTVEEYLQQVHEMTMLSAIQGAQKDNLRAFNGYMMKTLEDEWQKEKRDFLHTLSRLPLTLAPSISTPTSAKQTQRGQVVPYSAKSSQEMQIRESVQTTYEERKPAAYAAVVVKLNDSRERSISFNAAAAFKEAWETVADDVHGSKSVMMRKVWQLIQSLVSENVDTSGNLTRKMQLIIAARHHLEEGHEKYIRDTIQNHPAQAALGGSTGNLQLVHAFLRVRLRDHGLLDFDGQQLRRQPPFDTTWHQIFFCLRTGYYEEAKEVAESSRVSRAFASQLIEWISTRGIVSESTSASATEECERMMRTVDRPGRVGTEKYKLLVYAIVSGSRQLMDKLLREIPTLFNTIEDFLWFNLAVAKDDNKISLVGMNIGMQPYTIEDLQTYLLKFEPSYYTRNGKDPLVYPYVLLLSLQLHAAISYLVNEPGSDNIDAVHIAIAIADSGVLIEKGMNRACNLGSMDTVTEIAGIIRYYGLAYKRQRNLALALEYYVQAAAAMGGGISSWGAHASVDLARQRQMMLKQLLSEILLSDGGVQLLLGPFGTGSEGALRRFIPDHESQCHFLLEVASQCQESGVFDKAIELLKRVGAFAAALEIVNNRLSDAVNSVSIGRMDGETKATGLILAGNSIIEATKVLGVTSIQDREMIAERQAALRQLETILTFHKLARNGKYSDALVELSKLSFLPLDNWKYDLGTDSLQNVQPSVKACIPELLKVALSCLDNIPDVDGSIRRMRGKIASFIANALPKGLPNELYERVARML